MSGLIYNRDAELIQWASDIIGFTPRPDAKAIGWHENEVIRAVVIYDGFSECDCNIHVASDGMPHWFKRQFLIAAFMHPFIQWNLRRITGLVPAKNKAALRFDLHLGFKQEGIIRNALPDDDIILLGMLKSECIYLPKQYRT